MSCATSSVPSAVPRTIVTGSPSSAACSIRHSLPRRPSTKTPLRVPTTKLPAISASRKRLEDVHLAVRRERVGQVSAVTQVAAVDENLDVLADLALIVEHEAAHVGPAFEVALEELRYGARRQRRRRTLR